MHTHMHTTHMHTPCVHTHPHNYVTQSRLLLFTLSCVPICPGHSTTPRTGTLSHVTASTVWGQSLHVLLFSVCFLSLPTVSNKPGDLVLKMTMSRGTNKERVGWWRRSSWA